MGLNATRKKGTGTLYVVIMAGGKGRRFWPRSRGKTPKQLLAIGVREPMIKETVNRLLPLVPPERLFISCGRDLAGKIRAMVPEVPKKNYVLEPVGRDTAACIGLSLELIGKRPGPPLGERVVAVLPADHWIQRPARFRKVISQAARAAIFQGHIITIGIEPDWPSPAYGYICPGTELEGSEGVRRVRRFVEKPDAKNARQYLARGYLWNAGMFVFRHDVMEAEFKRRLPGLKAGLERIGADLGTRRERQTLDRVFPRLQKISIDYGIMEKAKNVAVVEGDFGWRDVGGWDALYRLLGGDGKRNVTRGKVVTLDSTGCYAEGERLVALVGARDLVVIETGDAVLVIDRHKESSLKDLIKKLESQGMKEVI